jgi:uncharacterized membrane protein
VAAELDARPATRSELVSLVLAAIGLAVSVYLTIEHYAAPTSIACPESGAINCTKVTTSEWAKVGPVPLALLGAIFFAAMTALCIPAAWRRRRLDPLRIAGAGAAVAAALYLVWVELFKVEAICLWCTVVHVASLLLLIAVLWATTGRELET